MDFPEETASTFPCDATIYPELHMFWSINAIGFSCTYTFMKLLSVPWPEFKMSLLVENKYYPSWDGQTARQFPAIPAMSSNSFLLYFISPFVIFTAQYFSISWYLLPFGLTKYLTTCYLASYSALISGSSVSTSLQWKPKISLKWSDSHVWRTTWPPASIKLFEFLLSRLEASSYVSPPLRRGLHESMSMCSDTTCCGI